MLAKNIKNSHLKNFPADFWKDLLARFGKVVAGLLLGLEGVFVTVRVVVRVVLVG